MCILAGATVEKHPVGNISAKQPTWRTSTRYRICSSNRIRLTKITYREIKLIRPDRCRKTRQTHCPPLMRLFYNERHPQCKQNQRFPKGRWPPGQRSIMVHR